MKRILDADLGMHILELEITSRCNLNCLHCYNRPKKNYDLPLANIKNLFLFAKKYKISNFVISGGEARMHPDFKKICAFLKKNKSKGMRLILQTNGTIIDDNFFEIAKIFDVIHISFDSSDLVRANSSSNLFLAKELLKRGINCYLFTTLHRENYKDLSKIVRLANKNRVPIGFNVCLPTEKITDEFSIPIKDFFGLEKKLFYLSKNNKILRYSSPLIAIFDHDKKKGYIGNHGGCVAGIASCVVSFNGDVLPCPFLREPAGNIFKSSLLKIWNDSNLFNLIRNRSNYQNPCGKCEYLSYCGGCRNRALKSNGEILASDPFCHLILKNNMKKSKKIFSVIALLAMLVPTFSFAQVEQLRLEPDRRNTPQERQVDDDQEAEGITNMQNQGNGQQNQSGSPVNIQLEDEQANNQAEAPRRSRVANAVQLMLQVAERNQGIGEQVRTIAQAQIQNQEQIEASLEQVKNRGALKKFFLGPDYKSVELVESKLLYHEERIEELKKLISQVTNPDDVLMLEEQISVMEQIKTEVEDEVFSQSRGFSLFGWLGRMLAR